MGRKRIRKRTTDATNDAGERLTALQRQTHKIATTWYRGCNLELLDVNMGQCVEYSVIQNVNTAVRAALEGDDDDRTE